MGVLVTPTVTLRVFLAEYQTEELAESEVLNFDLLLSHL